MVLKSTLFTSLFLIIFYIVFKHFSSEIDRYSDRIVGGDLSVIEDFPYQLAVIRIINIESAKMCGGSIISNKYGLTAGHCTQGPYQTILARAGSVYFDKGGINIAIQNVVRHEKYAFPQYDISILKFSKSIVFSSFVKPVHLPSPGMQIEEGTKCNASGWGTIREDGPLSDYLLYAELKTVNWNDCKKKYRMLSKHMMCASEVGKDSCRGDSGGPLVTQGIQIGIVSGGYECASSFFPGFYVSLANSDIRKWIQLNTNI